MSAEELPTLDMTKLPVRVDRETGAKLLTKYFFRISPRSLERWPVAWRRLNGKAHCDTQELFGIAEKILAAAPAVKSGHLHKPQPIQTA